MAKLRLNETTRRILREHARALVSCPAEQKAADQAHAACATLVRKMIEARFPPKDMLVLKRYEVADRLQNISIQLNAGGFQCWKYKSEDQPPLQPGRHSATFLADKQTTTAVERTLAADAALNAALEKKLGDYYSLISSAGTFEDVCEVWPEAEGVRSRCGGSAIVIAVTPEVVARIRQDVATRAKAA